jgi:hypothetical protein
MGWGLVLAHPAWAVEDVRLEFDPQPRAGTYSVRVEGVLDAPPAAVRHTLMHLCEIKETTAYLRTCVVFNTRGQEAWSYVVVDPPVLDPRDYTVRRTIVRDLLPDGSGEMHMDFRQAHESGPPPRPGVIRVQVNEGSWLIRPADGGRKTSLVYALTLNPGGSVPLWMARLAARRATPAQLERIERAARQQQQQGKVRLPMEASPWADITPQPLPGPAINTRPD